jgi:hypothetical protein
MEITIQQLEQIAIEKGVKVYEVLDEIINQQNQIK